MRSKRSQPTLTKRIDMGLNLNDFLARRHDLSPVRDRFVLPLRVFRNLLAEGEANEKQWGEIAGMINVTGLYATEKRNDDWLRSIIDGATALREISDRNTRMGGRWAAKENEVTAITEAINIIDAEILPTMPTVDFIRLAKKVNAVAVER